MEKTKKAKSLGIVHTCSFKRLKDKTKIRIRNKRKRQFTHNKDEPKVRPVL